MPAFLYEAAGNILDDNRGKRFRLTPEAKLISIYLSSL